MIGTRKCAVNECVIHTCSAIYNFMVKILNGWMNH